VFLRFDADGGGSISKAEFLSFMNARGTRLPTKGDYMAMAREKKNNRNSMVTKESVDDETAVKQLLQEFQRQLEEVNLGSTRGNLGIPSRTQWDIRNDAWERKLEKAEGRVLEMKAARDTFHDRSNTDTWKFTNKPSQGGWQPGREQKRKTRFFEEAAKEATMIELQHVTRFNLSHIEDIHRHFPPAPPAPPPRRQSRAQSISGRRDCTVSPEEFTEVCILLRMMPGWIVLHRFTSHHTSN
jgi:hypothetical protein